MVRSTLKLNAAMVRSTLKLNASILDSKIGGLRSLLAEDQKWGGARIDGSKTAVFGHLTNV